MTRITDASEAQALIGQLTDAGFTTAVTVEPDGVDIQIQPTDDLIAVAILVAQKGFRLQFDGRYVRVYEAPLGDIPATEVDEHEAIEAKIAGRDWTIEHDASVITEEAAALALSYGLKVDDLVAQKIGSGADGRITKADITNYVKGIT
jgi:hypothetical protein